MHREPTAISLVAMATPSIPVRSHRPISENVVKSMPRSMGDASGAVSLLSVAHRGERGVMERAVAREDGASVDAGPAIEIGETSSRLFHEDLERGDVPRLHRGRERDLTLTLGHPEIGREVTEASLDLRLIGEAQEAVPVPAPSQEIHRRVDHERALEVVDGRDADQLAVTPRALAAKRRVEHVHGRLIDDAGGDFAVLLEPDQHGPRRNAANEIPSAVDRID